MLLAKIIAQGLAVAGALLDKHADASGVVTYATNCFSFDIYNVTLTDCGTELVMAELIEDMIELVTSLQVLPALFSVSH